MVLMECASNSVDENHAVTQKNPFSYGRAVGLLHEASAGFSPSRIRKPLDNDALIAQPLAAVEAFFPSKETGLRYLKEQASRLTSEINKLNHSGLRHIYLHGDLTGGNANWDAGGQYTFFDFDCCGYGWQAYDLAVFLWSLIQNGKLNLWDDFLEGYRSVAQLGKVNERSIGLFVAARSSWIMGYSLSRVGTQGSLSYKSALFESDISFLKRLQFELPVGLRLDLDF